LIVVGFRVETGRGRAHIIAMTDEWTETLNCSKCRTKGTVSLSQRHGAQTPTVQSISDEFRVVTTPYGPTFICGTCVVEAEAA
jgi:hypothetical protein